jgi:hypothetical protein
MNSKMKNYTFRNKQAVINERIVRAAGRAESYKFHSSNSIQNKSNLIASEFYKNYIKKVESFNQPSSKWSDRESLLGAPYSAEIFLNCDRGMSETFLGCPRYYGDELVGNNIPDARSRFPYDRVAHMAAKCITRLFRRMLNRKNRAALIIQRNIRRRINLKKTIAILEMRRNSINMLKKTYKTRRGTIRKILALRDRQKAIDVERAIMLRKMADIAKEGERLRKLNKLQFVMMVRIVRAFIKRMRKARARKRRLLNYVVMIQRKFRWKRARNNIRKFRRAQMLLKWWWRARWKKKYKKFAVTITRSYRNYLLRKAVRRIQKCIRGYLGRKFAKRKRLELISAERYRLSRERVVIGRNIQEIVDDISWSEDESQLPPITLAEHMRKLDMYAAAVITGSVVSQNLEMFKSIHPVDFGEDENETVVERLLGTPSDEYLTRIVKAILLIFANKQSGCIDWASLTICKSFLRPKSTGTNKISDEAWESLTKIPMVNIEHLSQVLEPTRAVRFKVSVEGQGRYLPYEVLAKAAIVNRWTLHYDWSINKMIKTFRKMYPPRRVCALCMEPMTFDWDVYDHRRCTRNGYMSWMMSDIKPAVDSLIVVCKKLKVPKITRDYITDTKILRGYSIESVSSKNAHQSESTKLPTANTSDMVADSSKSNNADDNDSVSSSLPDTTKSSKSKKKSRKKSNDKPSQSTEDKESSDNKNSSNSSKGDPNGEKKSKSKKSEKNKSENNGSGKISTPSKKSESVTNTSNTNSKDATVSSTKKSDEKKSTSSKSSKSKKN